MRGFLSRRRQEQEEDSVPEQQNLELLEVRYLGWLMEQMASWRRWLCGGRAMQGGHGHVCAPTLA